MTLDLPFSEREENHCKVIRGTLTFVIRSSSKEMIGAVGEVELSEIDGETCDEADPKRNPERLAPEVTRRQHRQQHVQ